MTEKELVSIFELPTSAIIAPAGHGKTEMIADIVSFSTGKQLLLTHTNAGVDALKKRLEKRNISQKRFCITTIAAFCVKWCASYSYTAVFDVTLSPLMGGKGAKKYYAKLYAGAKKIFETPWAGKILNASYTGIVVDEYQDCTQQQHEIILAMSQYLPVRVFGDPMQGIFSFAGKLVDWGNLEYPIVKVATEPWRWKKTNPALGNYLTSVREQLMPILSNQSCAIRIDSNNQNINIIDPNTFTGFSLLRELEQYSSVVYMAKWPKQQLSFCEKMPGIFQYDEKQDCDELFSYATLFDQNTGASLALAVIKFVSECSTKVNLELASYINRLKANSFDFSRIKKHIDFGKILEDTAPNISKKTILEILTWFLNNSVFKRYRTELLSEMKRSIEYAIDYDLSIFEAANHVRKDSSLQKRYTNFKFLSSRTLLSKGLEFDCVIIDMTTPLSAKDFYVAMTRAMKKIYIVSTSNEFVFDAL